MFEGLNSFSWQQPLWLWLLCVPVILWGLGRWRMHFKQANYADATLWPWVKYQGIPSQSEKSATHSATKSVKNHQTWWGWLKTLGQKGLHPNPILLLAVAWSALVMALANPQILLPSEQGSKEQGVDVLQVLDVSRSMLAEDVVPNRFLQARALMESLNRRSQAEDRFGLAVFAGQAHSVLPLTYDKSLLPYYLQFVAPNQLPLRGSSLLAALTFAERHLAQTGGHSRVAVIWTDGAAFSEQSVTEEMAAELNRLANAGVRWVLVGVGTPRAVRIPNAADSRGVLYARGGAVTSGLDELGLRQLAQALGGHYLTASEDGAFMEALLAELTLPAGERTGEALPEGKSQAVWFMALALLALLWAFYPLRLSKGGGVLNGWGIVWGVLFFTGMNSWSPESWAISPSAEQQAYQAFQEEDYERAQRLYDLQTDYTGWFGLGASAYRLQDMEMAVFAFREAALKAREDEQRASALFNLGNGYFTVGLVDEAVEAYRQALLYRPSHPKAQQNLALALLRQAQEAKQASEEADAIEQAEKSGKNKESEGAFYGGQKPSETGGLSDQEVDGLTSTKEFVLPEAAQTDFSQPKIRIQLDQLQAGAIQQQAQRVQQLSQFEMKMRQVEDKQAVLLQRIFEREAGFQAPQAEPHQLPGVAPW